MQVLERKWRKRIYDIIRIPLYLQVKKILYIEIVLTMSGWDTVKQSASLDIRIISKHYKNLWMFKRFLSDPELTPGGNTDNIRRRTVTTENPRILNVTNVNRKTTTDHRTAVMTWTIVGSGLLPGRILTPINMSTSRETVVSDVCSKEWRRRDRREAYVHYVTARINSLC